MKKLAIIDNYEIGMPKHRIENFHYLIDSINDKIEASFTNFDELSDFGVLKTIIDADGIILTGSELNLSDYSTQEKMKNVINIIRNYPKPLLGICFGHQLIGFTFGYCVDYMKLQDSEWEQVIKLRINPGFQLINREIIEVEVTHRQEIKYSTDFKKEFDLFGSSKNCRIHVIKHRLKPIFGVQFHPETNESPTARQHGLEIFQNFISLI